MSDDRDMLAQMMAPSVWDRMRPNYREAEEWKPDKGSFLREAARKALIARGVGEGQAADFAGLGGKGASTASADWAPLTGMAFAASDMLNPQTPGDTALAATSLIPGSRPAGKIAGQAVDTATDMLRAYHSSPHKFDKFEWSPRTARTGEGGAAYGEGLYLAENPAVSGRGGQYWNQFQRKFSGPESIASGHLNFADFDRAKAIEKMRQEIVTAEEWLKAPHLPGSGPTTQGQIFSELQHIEKQKEALRLLESGQHVGPHTYEVGINAKPGDLLDWDAPISQQPEAVQRLAKKTPWGHEPRTGENVYRSLQYADNSVEKDPLRASQVLRDAGVPGHRFLDQGSRYAFDTPNAPPKTRNYVIWDPSILHIDKRYAGAAAVPAAGLAGAAGVAGAPGEADAASLRDQLARLQQGSASP